MVQCLFVSYPRFIQFALGSCYTMHINRNQRIVNIKKVYIEKNNIEVELLRFRKDIALIHVYVCERVSDPLYVYSIFVRWQQLTTNKLITIHSPDGSTPRYAHLNEWILTV